MTHFFSIIWFCVCVCVCVFNQEIILTLKTIGLGFWLCKQKPYHCCDIHRNFVIRSWNASKESTREVSLCWLTKISGGRVSLGSRVKEDSSSFFKFHFAFEMCSSLRIYNRKAAFTLPQTLVAFFFSPLKCTSLCEEGNGRTIFSISISLENQWKLHSAVDGVVNEWMQPHNFSGLYKLEGEKQTPCGQSASYLGEFFKRYSECPGVNLLPLFSRMAVI